MKHVSSFSQIPQWLEHVQGKHEVPCLNPTRASFLDEIEKQLNINSIYIDKLRYNPMTNLEK